jgi:hypothetical protein
MAEHSVVFCKREQSGAVRRLDEFGKPARIGLRRRALDQQRPLAPGQIRFDWLQDFSVTIRL